MVVVRSNMMGRVRRDSSSSSSVVVTVLLLLLLCTSFGVAVGSTAGFLYIDCGSNSTTVDALGISWVPDDGYITTGVNVPVVSDAFPNFPEFKTLRYFNDTRPKNCYSLPVMPNATYLIRASFFYGGYDAAAAAPSFQIAIDATVVANITKEKTNGGYEEFTVLTQNNVTYFCLLRDSSDTTPFISGLSVRPMKSYSNMDDNLVNFNYYRTLHRLNLGGPSLVRYPDDVYDRYWHGEVSLYVAASTGGLYNLSTTKIVTQNFLLNVVVPTAVLQTAVSVTGLNNLSLTFNQPAYSSFKSYLALYFAELSSSVTSKSKRQFWIDAGPSYTIVRADVLDMYGIDVGSYWLYGNLPITSSSSSVVLYPDTFNTTYGPLLNAVEFFEIQDPAAMKTKDSDAAAIEDIKATMNLLEWTGDPCLPQPHSWLTCGITTTSPFPQVLAVNLSGYQLNTTISPSFGNLGALTSLALDNCGLNGSIPDLSALSSLTTLHLQNNILSGPVPDWLSTARNLKELFIENNNLSGNIDKLLGKNGLNFKYQPGNPLLNPSAQVKNTSSTNLGIIIGCVLGGILALAIIIFLVVYFVCLRRPRSASKGVQVGGDTEVAALKKARTLAAPGAKAFTLKELVVASENFKTQIGKGGFGPVFYGKLVDGQEVAIKVLESKSHQGSTEFFNEVDILSRVHHKNLVSLVGYCIDGETRMLLYEYIHEGSLYDHLHVESGNGLDWLTRLHIALNAAQGLDYLHMGCQPSMIHRDVKSSNILLTNRMESAKVSDFGLSKLTQGESDAPVSTFVKGTTGYVDPEYFTTNHVSTRSDVFSFGVVLLELITGRYPISLVAEDPLESNLCSWVRASLENGDIDKILDPNVRASQPNIEGLWKVVEVAMRSVEPKGVHRPTMSEVVDELRQAMAFEGAHSKGTSHTNTPSNLSVIKPNSYIGSDSDSQILPR